MYEASSVAGREFPKLQDSRNLRNRIGERKKVEECFMSRNELNHSTMNLYGIPKPTISHG